ncbi:MAG: hypothetical protein P8Y46_09200 [Sulfurovaceae bacterium]
MKDKNNQQINQRDYDKEPIEIEDNFTIRVFEFTFLIIFDVFIIYLIFYSGVIDWTQGSWHEVFHREMEKSFRFFPVVFGAIIVNIWALFSIFAKNIFKVFLWIYCFLFLKRKPYFSFTPYIFIFSVKTNSVMNIHISTQDDYRLLDKYFYETKGIALSSVSVCRKIANYYKG